MEASSYSRPFRSRPFSWAVFWICSTAAIALFFVPAFIIRPFRAQSPSGLGLAMALRQAAPRGTIAALLICLVLAFTLWERDNLRRKIVLTVAMVLVAFSAVMSRLNYFEWMFHPIDSARFEGEGASKLAAGEMIMAICFGNDARAYPIREMAYHHVLNDVVGGVPVAVTY